jgi:hypothetical protein
VEEKNQGRREVSELQALSGPSPFGGRSIADKQGLWPSAKAEETIVARKSIRGKRRSTAEEATIENSELTEVEIASKFVKNRTFVACCLKANIQPTKRQARKFRQGRGAAFEALKTL